MILRRFREKRIAGSAQDAHDEAFMTGTPPRFCSLISVGNLVLGSSCTIGEALARCASAMSLVEFKMLRSRLIHAGSC
jgi:hypothetical protein